jgi:ribosomal RNA assembly protein
MEEEINMTASRANELKLQSKLLTKIRDTGVEITIDKTKARLKSDNAFRSMLAKNAVTAFNRGFDSAISSLLLDDSYDIAVVNINDYTRSKKRQMELKGRVIGSRGMIKKRLMKETSCYIKIQGKTISIVGHVERIGMAQGAIEMILNGAKHDSVFISIDRKKLEAYQNGSS